MLGSVLPLKNIERAYKKVEDPKFNFKLFLEKNEALVQDTLLTEKELRRLMDLYVNRKSCRTGCQACMQPIDNTEDSLELPICRHIVHKTCMLEILLVDLNCPYCKKNIRIAMLQDKLGQISKPGSPGNISFDFIEDYSLAED